VPAPAPGSAPIPLCTIAAETLLVHVSREAYRGLPLHFGATASNRYDATDKSYGVLYNALDLPTALMESVFHKHRWATRKRRQITRTELSQRMVRMVGVLDDLLLADLTAANTAASVFGLNLSQLSSRTYRHTQAVSAIVVAQDNDAGTPMFDGIRYPSRNNYPGPCVAIFERARDKIDVMADINLPLHKDWPAFKSSYAVTVLPR
jgi:RES domain